MRKRKTSLVAIREVSDINLTPMMDLTFILLITFIITFPMIEQGIAVNLPKGKSGDLKNSETRSITVDRDGNLFLNDRPISKSALEAELVEIGKDSPETVVYVRADTSVNYGRVAELVSIIKAANLEKMALVTQAED
jgi:biopolymer transport protein TolR